MEAYALLDSMKSGSVSIQEISRLMKDLEMSPTEQEIHDILQQEFQQENLNFQHFSELMQDLRQGQEDAILSHIFGLFDTDLDGLVSINDLKRVLQKFTSLVDEEEDILEMFLSADQDCDGFINFKEFSSLISEK